MSRKKVETFYTFMVEERICETGKTVFVKRDIQIYVIVYKERVFSFDCKFTIPKAF